jgi:hypothetical protein
MYKDTGRSTQRLSVHIDNTIKQKLLVQLHYMGLKASFFEEVKFPVLEGGVDLSEDVIISYFLYFQISHTPIMKDLHKEMSSKLVDLSFPEISPFLPPKKCIRSLNAGMYNK